MDRSDQRQWGAKEVARLLTLVESERRYYQEILAILPIPVAVIDSELRLISTNRAFRNHFGISREEAPNKLEDCDPIPAELAHALSSRQPVLDFSCTLFEKHILASIAPLSSWEEGREAVLTIGQPPVIHALPAVSIPEAIVPHVPVAVDPLPEVEPEPAPVVVPVAPVVEQVIAPPVIEPEPEPEPEPESEPQHFNLPLFAWESELFDGVRRPLLSPEDGIAAAIHDTTSGVPFADWIQNVHPDEQNRVLDFYELLAQRGGRGSCEYRMALGNSWSLVRDAVEVEDADGTPIFRGVSFDLTRHYQGIQPGLETLRRETAGQLARSVTHELNNTLMIIQGYAEELHQGLSEHDPRRQDTHELVKATARAASTIARLQSYYRPAPARVSVFDLHSLVDGLNGAQGRLFENVELELKAGQAIIEFDATLLEHWLKQLVQDTAQRNPEATVTVSTRLIVWKDVVGFPGTATPGDYVALRVSATPAPNVVNGALGTLEFSSEAAAVHALAVSSGGCMWLVSPWDPNGVFQLWLPKKSAALITPLPPPIVEEKVVPPVVERKPKGRVMVVEDEEGIRSLERRLLERQGFDVVEAANGLEALDLIAAHPERTLDLLVTDWYMPGMTGMALMEAVRQKYPDLPALLVSGYADDAAVQLDSMPRRTLFLQKPFTLNSLAEAVESLLKP